MLKLIFVVQKSLLNGAGAVRQRVRALQVAGQSIRDDHQGDGEQNTQSFHAVTLACSEFYEIGCAPFFLSVFG